MPIFEYKCQKCGHKMDFLEKSSSKDKHICQKCGSSQMQKQFSGFSVGKTDKPNSSCHTVTCPFS
jgi:putative FmdB family regulatory protein